jgi:protease IV
VKLVRGAWKLLVAIKDLMVLAILLLFFGGLFAALSHRPNPTAIRDGALVLALNGSLVEQPDAPDPLAGLGGAAARAGGQLRLRDVVRALDAASGDARVKAVVLDLDNFAGGYPAAVHAVADAVGRVKAAGKPVFAHAIAYTDDSYAVAAHASEIWIDPLGGMLLAGPGGTQLYYKGLMDRLGVTAHIFKVGRFKSAVEPYARADMSPEAREANTVLYGGILNEWRATVRKARPRAQIDAVLAHPDQYAAAARGDLARAGVNAGLIDRIGDRIAFGKRVAQAVGAPANKPAGSFNAIRLGDWLAAHPLPDAGDAVGVITIAGEIVDGKGGAGTAGGDTVSRLILKGLATGKLKALVVRIDSPGGSAFASEQMRQAVLQAKAQGLPVVVSMGSLAASGGYWVATAGDTILARPDTITGSIGIFGVIPSFETALAKIGVTSDGVRTTPLSGQPDLTGGFTPEVERVIQSMIEAGYARFVGLVAQSRRLTPQRVDEIGQGRVWIGTSARQLGLVDGFGTLADAVAEAARRAKLDPARVHAEYLEQPPSGWARLLAGLTQGNDEEDGWGAQPGGGDALARIAAGRRALVAQALGDARRLAAGGSVQARCLECAALAPLPPSAEDRSLAALFLARFGL